MLDVNNNADASLYERNVPGDGDVCKEKFGMLVVRGGMDVRIDWGNRIFSVSANGNSLIEMDFSGRKLKETIISLPDGTQVRFPLKAIKPKTFGNMSKKCFHLRFPHPAEAAWKMVYAANVACKILGDPFNVNIAQSFCGKRYRIIIEVQEYPRGAFEVFQSIIRIPGEQLLGLDIQELVQS